MLKNVISRNKTLATLLALLILAPALAQAESLGFSIEDEQSSGDFTITVLDDQTLQAIPDATVTVSDLLTAEDYSGDFDLSFTSEEGRSRYRPLTSRPKSITAFKAGYSAISLAGVQATRVTLYLKPLETSAPHVISSGQVGGWNAAPSIQGKQVQVGLVFRSLSSMDLLHFSIASVVSPIMDTIDVWGERHIPSNVVMPKQTIPVFIGSVKVNKPNYRLPLQSGRETRLTSVVGEIASGDLIDIGQSGQVNADALNKFSFNRIGLSSSLVPGTDLVQNMVADISLSPTHTVTVTAPPFRADVMVAAVTDLNGDRKSMIPTDIKTPISISSEFEAFAVATLKSTSQPLGQSRAVMGIAITPDLKRLSGIFVEQAGPQVATGEFLNVVALNDSNSLPASVRVPAHQQGIGAAIFEAQSKQGEIIKKYPIWTIYTLPAAGDLVIPTSSMPLQNPVKSYALVQMDFGAGFNERAVNGQTAMMNLKRFARSMAKIGK